MNINTFYSYLQNNNKLSENSELKDIAAQYPYFSIPQMLYISSLYQSNDNSFAEYLKTFSHNIPDRKHFFQFLKYYKSLHTNENKKNLQESSSPFNEENTTPSKQEINKSPAFTTTDVFKELNKSMSESIIQSELLQMDSTIKAKTKDFVRQNDDSQEQSNDTKKQFAENDISETLDKSGTLPPNSLSRILKQFSNKNDLNRPHASIESSKKEKIKQQQEIIDKILSNPPKSSKITEQQKFYSAENKAKESLLETEDLVTETLAQIYASQGNIHKAIRAYEILSLKFPQKNTYFAAKINELKNQLKK